MRAFLLTIFPYLDSDGPVPVVTLFVNGGTAALISVKETLDIGLPVVVISGTGGAADTIAFAFKTAQWYV